MRYGRRPGLVDGWVCQEDDFPAIKWFSTSDVSGTYPTPVTCSRVDRQVAGVSWREWTSWLKLAKYLSDLP